MIIKINRIYGNADFTIGIATIVGYSFRAYSLERRSADHSRAANKRNNHAFPCGEYPFRFETTRLSPLTPVSYLLKGFGRMTFRAVKSYDSLGTGHIALFSKYPHNGEGEIDERVYNALSQHCYSECSQHLPQGNKFVIEEDDEFYYDENWHQQSEQLFEDDDFIDPDENELQ